MNYITIPHAADADNLSVSSIIPPVPDPPATTSSLRHALEEATTRTMMCGNRLYSLRYHDLTICRPCPIPRRGPGIVVCNHISGLDPLLLQSACPRLINWMMAAEYYTQPLGWLLRLAGVIPVQRHGRDLGATRTALRALREGKLLGIFPEGRISTTGKLLPFQSGVAVMATRSGAPVYPAHIQGSQAGASMARAFSQPHTSQLTFGQALRFSKEDPLDTVIHRIQCAVAALAENNSEGR